MVASSFGSQQLAKLQQMLLLIETNHSLVILVVFSSGGLGVVRPRLAAFASKKCSETQKIGVLFVYIARVQYSICPLA